MADLKITDLTELTTTADGDISPIVDVSDTSMSVTGTDKKITWANIKANLKTYFDTLYQATGSYLTSSNISDTAYGVGWNGDTTNAPSKNAVYDQMETRYKSGDSPSFATVTTSGNIELGHASDTTLSRVSAGVVAVEGNNILTTATGLPLSGGTMTGNITLGENTSIALDPAGSADGKYSGITVTGTAGYAQTFGDLVYLDPTDSRWEKCDANAASGADGDSRGIIGIVVVAGAADGNACTILLHGIIRADAAFPALTVNNPVYVSETAGAVTQTQPTTTDVVIRIIGFALTADEIYFNPENDYITHT